MKINLVIACLLGAISLSSVAHAAAPPVIAQSVATCDPNAPTHCLAPNADGSINTGNGGSPTAPDYVAQVTKSTTDRSISSITTGGTAQQLMPINITRRSFYVFNPNISDICWASVTSSTPAPNIAGSFPLQSLGGFGMENNPPTTAFYVNCPTTGDAITAWESQ